eukprot:Phypoly_transcript_07832.p1 GENE.Phypoly_transcript_07832~~Phypoly_transcript_07832.p1  ORF type:complete len:450 (+),score=54.87 Phypoly_transcript_07832:194-1543(+)
MGSPEDSLIRDLEIKSLQSEAEWFVGCEVPKVGRRIKRILQHCLAFLSPRGTKELELITDLVPPDEDDDVIIPELESTNKLASFDTQEGLKGFISVGGWSISSAEITAKFPKWNKGVPHKATVSNAHPWRLYQLQNAYNFVKMTLNELNLLIRQCETVQYKSQEISSPNLNNNSNSNFTSSTFNSPNSLTQQTALAAVNKVVGQVSKWITLARDSLMLPNKSLLFPYSLNNQGFQGFHPPLPQDLHIEFNICNSEIIISVYALYVGSGPLPMYDTPSQKGALGVSSPLPHKKSDKGPLSPSPTHSSSTLSAPGSGMKHKTPSVGNLLNLPTSFNFGSLTSSSHGEKSQSQLSKVDEGSESPGQEVNDVPSISVNQPPSSNTGDHRVTIGGVVYKTYQITQRGQPGWVAVVDQSEVHCIVPRVNHTHSLLTSAINALADIEDKLVALSLL